MAVIRGRRIPFSGLAKTGGERAVVQAKLLNNFKKKPDANLAESIANARLDKTLSSLEKSEAPKFSGVRTAGGVTAAIHKGFRVFFKLLKSRQRRARDLMDARAIRDKLRK